MQVLIDHQIFTIQRYGGVSRYFVELARALNARSDVAARLLAPAYVNRYLSPQDALHPLSFAWDGPNRGVRFRPFVLRPLAWLAVRTARPAVWHETSYEACIDRLPKGVARVTTLHDMIVERFPSHFANAEERRLRKLAAMRRADLVICISHATERDLLSFYPEFAGKTHVVHHGVAQARVEGPKPSNLPDNYLLYVGTRQAYKNFDGLVRALGASNKLPPDLQLVCFGGGALTPAERKLVEESGFPLRRVRQMQGDDQLLSQAYRHARLFVFPSRYEGFGMPLTEAMVQGTPIACAKASCFPEICEDAAAYFDPDDLNDIRGCLESLLENPDRLLALGRDSQQRAAVFTWQRCAEQTLMAYAKAVESHGVR
ncbi:glycosyltransferase family 4 protein [Roseateles paludis]|uniref:Glycosyltransferase family 1 protein n=1 Tax=Roseateles paludis TaxID=3145238 RepID=A0ABV0G6M8_9BURK